MRIGIGVKTHPSIFINGDGVTAISIYDSIRAHYPTADVFIIPFGELWADFSGVNICNEECHYDIYIDCTGACFKERYGTKNILLLRKPVLMSINECSIHPQIQSMFYPENYDEVWVTAADDMEAAQIVYKCPVKVIDIPWTSRVIEEYLSMGPAPHIRTWRHLASTRDTWTIRICENNISQMNPYLFPLFAAGCLSTIIPVDKIVLHNSEHFRDNEFFRTNIVANLADSVKERIIYGGRNRTVDWIYQPRTVILSYMRWRTWRPALFDALWVGIPIIHNSTWLRDRSPLFARYYYEGNSIVGCERCFQQLQGDWEAGTGYFATDALQIIRSALPSLPSLPLSPSLYIGFVGMWPAFNPTGNFIIDMVQTHGITAQGQHGYKGADIVVAGPFGKISDDIRCPIIYYSGENTDAVDDPRIILNLCHREGPNCIRLPHWVTCINWFNTQQEGRNPVQLPLEWAITPQNTGSERKFAAFVVSNPMNPVRNDAFTCLSSIDRVDSAGRLYNNVGDALWSTYAGGGGGERKKVEWLRNYKFCITYENSMAPGYVTEKLLHAKMAGCIPLYWGDSAVHEDFVEGSFIDCTAAPEKIGEFAVAADPVTDCTPPLDTARVNKWRSTFAQITAHFTAKYTPTVYVTYTSARFIDSLHIWLGCVLRLPCPKKIIVYLYQDVDAAFLRAAWPTVTFLQFPVESPAFPDYWDPAHYAAKLWLFNDLLGQITCDDRVLFTDVACAIIRLPYKYLAAAYRAGAAFYRDDSQQNRRWCSAAFCAALQVTEEELDSQQTISGFLAFTAAAAPLIKEAYELSKQRHIIIGEKWINNGGIICGHRHDQSILSILALRYAYPWIPMGTDYTHTHVTEKTAFFAHRQLQPIKNIVDSIIKTPTFVVNLDRRPDRWAQFEETHCDLHFERWSATDGQTRLTPDMVHLFRSNTYNWKKATIGCAHSHYRLWKHLAASTETMYIILEDDARAEPTWNGWWIAASQTLPADFDVLFLGGVLPANAAALQICLDPHNSYWSKIRPNDFFIKGAPYFHFCTYSYIISQRGAKKLLNYCEKNGCNLPADHMLVNNYAWLNIYVASALQFGCKQDSDPNYINARLNDYSKTNTFDSDIWNNTDCWGADDISKLNLPQIHILRDVTEAAIIDTVNQGKIPLCFEKIDTQLPIITVTDETASAAISHFEQNPSDAMRYYAILMKAISS